ncbi:hypothetical protein [Virgibacillus ainsalahensis]
MDDQQEYYELLKMELDIFKLENKLKHKRQENKVSTSRINGLKKEISSYNSGIKKVEKEQHYYLKQYDKILQSTSWKVMAPVRIAGSLIRNLTGKNRS